MNWRIHHKVETCSTNIDAREGSHGDVFTADYQSAGRGRLDHKWLSPAGVNIMLSAVVSVDGIDAEQVATLPLVAGLAVSKALSFVLSNITPVIKWPNDVLVEGKKLAGILCERRGDFVIIGIGVNVGQKEFSPEIADHATSIDLLKGNVNKDIVLQLLLQELGSAYQLWREEGFVTIYPAISERDFLKGRRLSVRQTDNDIEPIAGISNGILEDGSLDVGGTKVYAGEAHVEAL